MNGGIGDDIYYVDSAFDLINENAGEGIDEVQSTAASYSLGANPNVENLVFIGTGDFTGIGNSEDNIITGGQGNDTLEGRAGNDTLSGAAGNDTFDFRANFGTDTITDFAAGDGIGDVIQLDQFADYASVISSSQQVGADTVITYDASNTITLRSVTLATLAADDFLFV
jgi:serralysin